MISDKQYWRLRKMRTEGKSQQNIADALELSRSTVEKHLRAGEPPSAQKLDRDYKTRPNAYDDEWDTVENLLNINPNLQVKTIFEYLQRSFPGKYQDGQKRTLERRVRSWRVEYGPEKEVYFEQNHFPGDIAASDFTKMNNLGITIQRIPFEHMLYHFVLTYSNWETATICYSESFESLSEGFQNAVWELGGVPARHRTDNLGAAVINMGKDKGEMTIRYDGLLNHYGLKRSKISPGKPNENGDVERSNGLLKKAIEQQLMLRGSCDFEDIKAYEQFLRNLLKQLNAGRSERLAEEMKVLSALPKQKLDAVTEFQPTISKHSVMRLNNDVYSVWSRLIGHTVKVKQRATEVEIWHGDRLVDIIPRIVGKQVQYDYRHVIGSLVRKPGAFENFKYKAEMYPTSHFREAYDNLVEHRPKKGVREYLQILELAAMYSETAVDIALKNIMDSGKNVTHFAVFDSITAPSPTQNIEIHIDPPDLNFYDLLIQGAAHEEQNISIDI